MVAILWATLSNSFFSYGNCCHLIKFWLKFVSNCPINNKPVFGSDNGLMSNRRQTVTLYLNLWLHSLIARCCRGACWMPERYDHFKFKHWALQLRDFVRSGGKFYCLVNRYPSFSCKLTFLPKKVQDIIRTVLCAWSVGGGRRSGRFQRFCRDWFHWRGGLHQVCALSCPDVTIGAADLHLWGVLVLHQVQHLSVRLPSLSGDSRSGWMGGRLVCGMGQARGLTWKWYINA